MIPLTKSQPQLPPQPQADPFSLLPGSLNWASIRIDIYSTKMENLYYSIPLVSFLNSEYFMV